MKIVPIVMSVSLMFLVLPCAPDPWAPWGNGSVMLLVSVSAADTVGSSEQVGNSMSGMAAE